MTMAPTSGFGSVVSLASAPDSPPSPTYTAPVACIVMASAARLNAVRYGGYRLLHAGTCTASTRPASATIIASFGPSSISAIRSAAYETESVQLLLSDSGSSDLPRRRQAGQRPQRGERERVGDAGRDEPHGQPRSPAAMIAATYDARRSRQRPDSWSCRRPTTPPANIATGAHQ